MNKPLVSIVMGSKSDLELVKETMNVLDEFKVAYEVNILSAHRTPDETVSLAKDAYDRGIRVFIAAAGGAAHLAGVIAGSTVLPVIGIPMPTNLMGGLDSLLSVVQMPQGVPVACVAVGKAGCKNAALLACQILATFDIEMHKTLLEYKEDMKNKVLSTRVD